MVRLPHWLWFGYFPIKVLHDYGALPLWRIIRPIADFLGRARKNTSAVG
jgi:hypothetical protein